MCLSTTSRSYLAMHARPVVARGRGGEPTSPGVAIPHFAMPRAGKFWFQFPKEGAIRDRPAKLRPDSRWSAIMQRDQADSQRGAPNKIGVAGTAPNYRIEEPRVLTRFTVRHGTFERTFEKMALPVRIFNGRNHREMVELLDLERHDEHWSTASSEN
jgi:hypothetical protein